MKANYYLVHQNYKKIRKTYNNMKIQKMKIQKITI